MEKRKCKVCGKEFLTYSAWITKGGGKFCSDKCKRIGSRKRKKMQCQMCGKEFYVVSCYIKRGGGKFCSRKCCDKWRSNSEKGEKNPYWKGGKVKRICEICGKEFLIRPCIVKRGGGKFCSRKCMSINMQGKKNPHWKSKIKKVCLTCGREFYVIPSRIKRGGGKFCSKSCKTIYNIMHNRKKDTSIERAVEQELQRRHIPYMKQVPIPFAHTIVDFLLPDKLVIYADGDYWHSSQKIKYRDINQDTLLTLSGYQVFRLKEKDIRKNPARCVDKIFKVVKP